MGNKFTLFDAAIYSNKTVVEYNPLRTVMICLDHKPSPRDYFHEMFPNYEVSDVNIFNKIIHTLHKSKTKFNIDKLYVHPTCKIYDGPVPSEFIRVKEQWLEFCAINKVYTQTFNCTLDLEGTNDTHTMLKNFEETHPTACFLRYDEHTIELPCCYEGEYLGNVLVQLNYLKPYAEQVQKAFQIIQRRGRTQELIDFYEFLHLQF